MSLHGATGDSAGGARQRPISAQSRSAWDQGNDNAALDTDEPAAMEAEEYRDGRIVTNQGFEEIEVEESQGCWYKFKRGIRSIWATRHTEDTGENKELYITTTLRELIVYCIFLIVLMILTFGMTSSTMYYYTKVMSELFLDAQYPDTKGTFRTSSTISDFWRFAKHSLMSGLYWETWYNNANISEEEKNYIFYENKLLGVPRIRQLKVRPDSCSIAKDFQSEIKHCYAMYAPAVEDKRSFGLANGTAWNYTTAEETGLRDFEGKISTYEGGGFYQDLTRDKNMSLTLINKLFDNLWIARGTRVVFVDFTVYNANINLFCVIKLIMEFPATGGAVPSYEFRTVKLLRYVDPMDFFVLACEVIFMIFIFYYVVEETIEIKKHKFAYFKSFWNWLDVIVILISCICAVFNVYRTLAVGKKIKELLNQAESYPDFDFLSYWQQHFNHAIALTVFAAWVKIFKYISFNKTMTQLSSTLGRCAKDLLGFAIMFFIVFFAFAQLGYLIFGTQVRDFREFQHSVFTLFRIILGDFDFHELENAHRVLGPVFFLLYVFFVFFVLINMFLAIINDTYSEVKSDLANQPNEFEMGDYFKKRAGKVMDKMNFRRDKIIDIQKAIQAADINNDHQLDFDEWRAELKTRGYADGEIEAVFAKYDLDGDRVLDEEEQRRMHNELEGQKEELNEQIENEGKRPRTATGSGGDLNDDDDEDFGGAVGGGGRGGRPGVSTEEFTVLARRVDRMEHSIGSIVSKIDAVLVKLEAMEKAKLKRRETMSKILDSITESDGISEEAKREQMERLVRDELERWDTEGSGASGSASPHSSRGRPNSSHSSA